MAVPAGCHKIGADRDRLILRTGRDGLASSVGHDLTIEVTRWSGEVSVAGDGAPDGLDVKIDMTSLAVREGTGGVKPLTGKDRRDIISSARKVLGVDRFPEALFGKASFQPGPDGGGTVSGTLSLSGQSGPVRLQITRTGENRFRATGSVVQSSFGIKPYRGFFGALKVRDAVSVEADVDLSQAAGAL